MKTVFIFKEIVSEKYFFSYRTFRNAKNDSQSQSFLV